MELTSYLAGEPWSDHPKCVSPVIAAFLRKWNDAIDDEGREALKPYAALVIGTKASKAIEDARGWLCADWLVHTSLPLWLRVAGLEDQAQALEALPTITSRSEWVDARPVIRPSGLCMVRLWRHRSRCTVRGRPQG